MVFFHGIGMNRRVYMKLLSRLPQLGFLVVAIDAPGHGETFAPRIGEHTFAHRIAVTERILEGLGIERAVLVGHSMGGRTAAELAARHPERALAVVLIDPAIGAAFDASRVRIASPMRTGAALAAAVGDTIVDRVGLRRRDQVRYMRTLSKLFFNTATHPATFASAAKAIARADDSATALKALRTANTRVVIFHGEQDKIVPLASAVDAASLSGALLVTLPKAYHSWVLNTPWTFTEILSRLIAENRLGGDLRSATSPPRRGVGPDSEGMSRPDALVHGLTPRISVLGSAYPQRRRMYHRYRIWDPQEITDFEAS
ncbi:alpha/beta hydrolase [Mycobacterium marseillense]|uniref:alpha/beta fold hydrolase n=1 Tax=Mycobacterium avium complex (MAC) TaxID=120793 RepID=UPI000678B16B|nr:MULTISPECIES: alpha/beta hydrolase [Mycobacterium avium complex (MAC)]MDM3973426.1 alpha/beta hydrolase [Mycobacterium marseillense]